MENIFMVEEAIEAFRNQTGILAEFNPPATNEREIDGMIHFNWNKQTHKFYVEVKKELRNHQLPELERLNKKYQPLLIIGKYIFPKIKEELRKQEIAYLETNGNAFLKNKNLFLWLENQKTAAVTTEKTGRAFTKTGLKLVFQFLMNDELINYPYRQMDELTGIGFGNINFIINDLKEQGFLVKLNKDTLKLIKKKELFNKWMATYPLKLKPAMLIGKFRFLKDEDFLNWKKLPLKNMETWWGGEPAGDLLTNYLKPGELTLYTTEKKMDIIKNYRLIPDDNGNVQVYQKFWVYNDVNIDIVPPLLVYADLMNTGDRRCIETAQKLYDELLQDKF